MSQRRRLQTALTARIKVAVPCSTDPTSIKSALDAINGLVGVLPPGSTLEFVGKPDFGKVPISEIESRAKAPDSADTAIGSAGEDGVSRPVDGRTSAPSVSGIDTPQSASGVTGGESAADDIPETLRRVPRHG